MSKSAPLPLRSKIIGVLVLTPVALVAIFAVGAMFWSVFLFQASAKGKCGGQTLGSPDPPLPRIARFHGEVVGKNLAVFQYRWLRRLFIPTGTTLRLVRELPSTWYQGNEVRHGERVGETVIDRSGKFDFGDLKPGVYDLTVTYPGDDAVGFGFIIDPVATSSDVLIDASPAEYCNCCGWNFEPH